MISEATIKEIVSFVTECQKLGFTEFTFGETGFGTESWNYRNDSLFVRPKIPETREDFLRMCKILGGSSCSNGWQAFVKNEIPKRLVGTYKGNDIAQQLLVKELQR